MSSDRLTVRMAVFVIVRNAEGKILLQKRMNTGYLDGYWDFPSGHVEPNESIHDSAVRELVEEVGVNAAVSDINLVHIDQYFLDKDYVNFVFEAIAWSGIPEIGEPEKVSELDWFDLSDLPEQCVNLVRVVEQSDFSSDLTYSTTTADSMKAMGFQVIG